jgi:hypothetical protein
LLLATDQCKDERNEEWKAAFHREASRPSSLRVVRGQPPRVCICLNRDCGIRITSFIRIQSFQLIAVVSFSLENAEQSGRGQILIALAEGFCRLMQAVLERHGDRLLRTMASAGVGEAIPCHDAFRIGAW